MSPHQLALSLVLFSTLSLGISLITSYKINKNFSKSWLTLGLFLGVLLGFLSIIPANIIKSMITGIVDIPVNDALPLVVSTFWCAIMGTIVGSYFGYKHSEKT